MNDPSKSQDKDLGVIQVLLDRLNKDRMPNALKLKDKVDRGERLTEYETRFLKTAIDETREGEKLAAKHPEYKGLLDEMTGLYAEIVRKGLENEKNSTESG